jgi:hypothetical protein
MNMQKSKAIPLQAWTGPEGSRRLRLSDLNTIGNMKVVRFSAIRTDRLYPRWYSFLVEAEPTPGSEYGRKDFVNENSQ